MTEYSYTVTHVTTATDITNDVETITVTETGSGEISSASIRLNSNRGQYFTVAPKIDEYHKIRIQITDDQALTFDKIYEVLNIVPVESSQEGNVLDLELVGMEYHLQRFFFAKQFYFASSFNVVKDIIDQYNATKATLQPSIVGHDVRTYNDGVITHDTNELPKWTANTYDFNVAEKRTYDGLVDVIERLGTTVAAGGANDFFELYFAKHSTDNTKIILKAFSSGGAPNHPDAGSEVTITDTDAVNGNPTEGGIESTQGTVIAGWGADDFGTQPIVPSKFHAELEAFALDPPWISGETYPQNARVQLNGVHYQSNINNNTSTPPTNWTSKNVRDYLTAAGLTQYSPWTDARSSQWKNSGSNPSAAAVGYSELGMWDSNLVIWDNNLYATQVVKRVNTDAVGAGAGQIPSQYLYGGTGAYRGFRLLVDPALGAIAGVFATNGGLDRFGVAYSGNVVQYNNNGNGDYRDWDVFKITANGYEVNVTHEGSVYIKEAGTWVDRHAQSRTNHCFHGYTSLSVGQGVNKTIKTVGPTTTYGDTSAIEVQFDYSTVTNLILTDANYYKIGAWLNLRFPFGHNTYNSVLAVGQLWGNNSTIREPATYDTNNLLYSHSGKVGWNHDEAEEYGPNSAITFALKMKWTDGVGALMLQGDFKVRCFMYDTEDNVVVQDFVLSHNDLWQDISLPLGNFKQYRARTPFRRTLDGTAPVYLFKDLDIVDTFYYRNIKMIGFQLQESYNDEGQFLPEGGRYYRDVLFTGSGRIIFSIDRLYFAKPLLAITDPVATGRALFPEFRQQPLISNYRQLKQDVLSWLEVAKFRHKQYDIKTEGRLDINFGDTFFLQKTDLVDDADTRTADSGGSANTIRLVAKKIILKISKSSSEGAHFVRYITGIKRIIS